MSILDSLNAWSAVHFVGLYYLAGTLLFLSVIVSAILWVLSALREDRTRAVSVVEWLVERDRMLLASRERVRKALPAEARGLLVRERFPKDMNYLTVLRERRVDPEVLDRNLAEDADCRWAALTLSTFALMVKRSPLDSKTAYLYTASDYTRWVEVWAPAIARLRQDDEKFFEDGIELYFRWKQQLEGERANNNRT